MFRTVSKCREPRKPGGPFRIRRSIFFQPLAVILVLLMLPGRWNLASTAQAATFTPQPGCAVLGGNSIIQQVCGPGASTVPNSAIIGAVQQWEQDSVTQFLQLYQLSATPADVAFVYQYGRSDLRNAIRGYMQLRMYVMATEDPSQLTANEIMVLDWFQSRWTYHEQNLYAHAIADYNSWVANPCTWRPDADVAKVVNLNYIACVGSILANNAPNTDYYLLAARKSEYENLLANLPPLAGSSSLSPSRRKGPAPAALTQDTLAPRAQSTTPGPSQAGLTLLNGGSDGLAATLGSVGSVLGLAGVTTTVLRTVPSLYTRINLTAAGNAIIKGRIAQAEQQLRDNALKIEQDALKNGDTDIASDAAELDSDLGAEFAEEAGIEAETTLEAGADGAGETFGISMVAAVVALAVTLAVTFTIEETDAVKQVNSQLQLASGQAFPGGYVNMPALLATQEGLYKFGVVWTEATYPDVPSSAALPSPSSSIQFINTASGQTQPVLGATYQDWSGNSWNMGYYNGYFLNNGTKNVTIGGQTTAISYDSINPIIRFQDWNNNQFSAAVLGTSFLVTKRIPASSDTVCAPSSSTGLSSSANVSTCVTQVVNQLQLIDGNGNRATVQVGTAPGINVPSGVTFSNNSVTSASVTATGIPTPSLGLTSGLVTFDGSQVEGLPFEIGYTSTGSGAGVVTCCQYGLQFKVAPGTYSLPLTASNILGNVTTSFAFNVGDPNDPIGVSTVSGPSGNVYYGQNLTWVFKATGPGPYTFYTNVNIPGMTFKDNGNGTAQFSGTPTGATTICTSLNYCGVWVTNTLTQAQTPDSNHGFAAFLPNIVYAPQATLSLSQVTFPIGRTTSYLIGVQASTPVSFSTPCGTLPYWFSITDNGNSTFTATGSPDQYAATSLPFVIFPSTLGAQPVENPCATPNFTAAVDNRLTTLSGSSASFQVGSSGSFTIQSTGYNGGTVVLDSPLPAGLQFVQVNQSAQGIITGTPNIGTGGDYYINYHLTPGSGQYSGNYYPAPLLLTIGEDPSLLHLPSSVYMMAGVPQTFVVKPTGFPTLGDMTVGLIGGIPSVPPGLTGSGDSEITTALGTYSLTGTVPASAAGNSYFLQFSAQNSLASTTGSTNITIVPPGDVNRDMVTNCVDYDLVKSLLNVSYTSSRYNSAADINSDGVINILDLAFVSAQMPKGTVCH